MRAGEVELGVKGEGPGYSGRDACARAIVDIFSLPLRCFSAAGC